MHMDDVIDDSPSVKVVKRSGELRRGKLTTAWATKRLRWRLRRSLRVNWRDWGKWLTRWNTKSDE